METCRYFVREGSLVPSLVCAFVAKEILREAVTLPLKMAVHLENSEKQKE